MRRTGMVVWTLLLALGLALGGCSDDAEETKKDSGGIKVDISVDISTADEGTPDQTVVPDATKPDRSQAVGNMGKGCTKSSDCTGAAELPSLPPLGPGAWVVSGQTVGGGSGAGKVAKACACSISRSACSLSMSSMLAHGVQR